jgi:hypothetical protein
MIRRDASLQLREHDWRSIPQAQHEDVVVVRKQRLGLERAFYVQWPVWWADLTIGHVCARLLPGGSVLAAPAHSTRRHGDSHEPED